MKEVQLRPDCASLLRCDGKENHINVVPDRRFKEKALTKYTAQCPKPLIARSDLQRILDLFRIVKFILFQYGNVNHIGAILEHRVLKCPGFSVTPRVIGLKYDRIGQ